MLLDTQGAADDQVFSQPYTALNQLNYILKIWLIKDTLYFFLCDSLRSGNLLSRATYHRAPRYGGVRT